MSDRKRKSPSLSRDPPKKPRHQLDVDFDEFFGNEEIIVPKKPPPTYPIIHLSNFLGEEDGSSGRPSGSITRLVSDTMGLEYNGVMTMSTNKKVDKDDAKAFVIFECSNVSFAVRVSSSQSSPEFGVGIINDAALQRRINGSITAEFHPFGMVGWYDGEMGWHTDDRNIYMGSDDPKIPNPHGYKSPACAKVGKDSHIYYIRVLNGFFCVHDDKSHVILCVPLPENMEDGKLYCMCSWQPVPQIEVTVFH